MHIGACRKSIATYLAAAFFAAASAAQAPSFIPTLITVAGNGTSGYTGDNGAATSAEIGNTVSAATADSAGNIYICDTKNNVIRKVTPAGIISTFAGNGTSGYTGDNIPATTAELAAPSSVRYHQGAIYITDFTNGRIRKVDLTTNIITTIAGGGAGALNNGSPSAVATAISIPQPQEIAFDTLGNMYWDQGGGTSRVDVLNLATGMAYIFAGTGGTTGATGVEIGAAGSGRSSPENTALNGVLGLVVDAQNNIYVVEYSTHVIRKITVGATPTISTYAGIGTVAGATVCAAATNTLGDGCPGPGATFGTIEHMSIDGAGNIYVADSTNNRIRMIAPNPSNPAIGGLVTTYLGTGTATESADGTYLSAATIGLPYDSQILPNGDLLIVDRTASLVRLLHRPGLFLNTAVNASSASQKFNVLTQAGTGTVTLPGATDFTTSSGAPACAAGVGVTGTVCSYTATFKPTIAGYRTTPIQFTDTNGTVIAGLAGTGLAPVASLLPGLAGTAAGTGVLGTPATAGNGAAATAATFQTPGAVATDSFGNIYVADTAANTIRKFAPSGNITLVAGTGAAGSTGDGAAATAATLSGPSGVAVDATGNVYIADTSNNKIRMVSAANGFISTVAGTGTAGYTGDQGTPAAATLKAPMQLAWSPLGVLYVADTGNSVVRAISLNEQLITTVAGNGTPSFDGDGGPGEAAELSSPQSIALDGNGNLYIADTGNNRVREISRGYITTLAGQTGSTFNGDGAAATATLTAPAGIAADLAGNVYVADTGNQRIRLITGGQIITIMGNGNSTATGDGATSNLATISSAQALTLDPAGNVYIADTGNHKIRSISVSTDSLSFKTINPNESSPAQTVSVYDSGNQNLAVSSVTIPATGYVEKASTSPAVDCTSAPLTLTPGTSCNLNTVFNPPALGPYSGTITIADNHEAVTTSTQTIQLQATSALVYTATLTIPSTATAGVAATGLLTVNNPITVYTRTMTFTSTDPQAVLPANHTFTTADNGSFTLAATFKTAGPQCLTATDTTDASVTSTACTNVVAAAAAKVVIFSGNNQTANVLTPYTQRLVALVTDAYGNTVSNAPVVFTINANGATTGTFSNGTTSYSTTADNTGYATALVITSGLTVGTFTATAALTGTSSTATFNLTVVVVGSFTIIPTSPTVGPLAPGASNSEILTIITAGGFNAPIIFTCKAPTGITCSAGSPPPGPFYASTQGSNPATLNFTSQGSLLGTQSGFTSPWAALIALAVGGLLLRRRRKLGALIVAVVTFATLGALSGCGEYYAPTTPNGTYTVTVTGTSQTASATASVTYTVQK